MALVVKDRVKETSTTTGTGTFTLAGAVTGFQAFSVIGDGNTTYYTITDGTDWEVGIGTYTSSGTTLSRDTILESSNSGNAVNWGAGSKDVFVTYPAEQAVYFNAAGQVDVDNLRLDGNTLSSTNTDGNVVLDPNGTGSVDVSSAKIINVATPTSGNDATNKTYVDGLISGGVHFHAPVRVESPINLVATYNNGSSGVGATLTNSGTQVALVIDGVTVSVNDRVLVYQQTNQTENGVYVVTNTGSVSTNWVLTRSSDTDTYVFDSPLGLSEGSTFFVQEGATGAGETYTCNTPGTITFGTTNITFVQVSSAQIYSAGAGLDLTGTQFSVETNGITNAMLRQSAGLSVIGRSANTTGDVADITAASDNEVLRRSGTSIGFGTVATGGIADDAVTNDKLRESAALSVIGNATNSTANPADIAAASDHQVLRRSGTGIGFGAVALNQAAAVTGALGFTNGGTGQTSQQAAMNALAGAITSGQYLRGNGTNVLMSSIQAGDVPTLNQNTTGSAATLTTARDIQTNLASTSAASFNGSANVTPGVTGRLAFSNLAQGSALSVLGVTGNATADNASIAAGTDHQVLRRSGTSVGFGAVALNQANAITGTLPVGNGGTGATTLTANNVILGNGTSAVSFVAPGSSGNVLTSNGTTWTSAAATGGGGDYKLNRYTSPATWTKPAGLKSVKVTVIGAGGDGGSSTSAAPAYVGAGGGGAGGLAIYFAAAPAIPGPQPVTAGPGTNSFGSIVSCTAGSAGTNGTTPGSNQPGGGGGSATGGTINIPGAAGGQGCSSTPGTEAFGGQGGSTGFGGGGAASIARAGISNTALSASASGYGNGGGGAARNAPGPATTPGGSGTAGIVIVEEFY